MRSAALSTPCRRVRGLRVALLIPFLALAARAAHLSLGDSRSAGAGAGQISTVIDLPPERGVIVDRNQVPLAISVEAASVYVLPAVFHGRSGEIAELAGALGVGERALRERLQGREHYTFVARWVSRARAQRVAALALPGVGLVSESRRSYPNERLAAHVLGFANIDGRGVRGVEQSEDAWLRGVQRRVPVERDGTGHLLALGPVSARAAAGGDVMLSLDVVMQAAAERALGAAQERTGAVGGMVLSMDPQTGEILSLAETPAFDPNRFREVDYAQTRSRAFLDALEPGSTLKVFLVAAALDAGVLRADETLDCSASALRIPGKTIRDRRAFGAIDAGDVLRVSSNIGAVRIAQRLPAAQHHAALRRFGFGSETGSGFPVESAGLLRSWRHWQPVDRATIAFGQGIGVTAIQLAAATSAIANGGIWIRPRLVLARRTAGAAWTPTPVERVRRVIDPHTASLVLEMMESVVGSTGTGRRAGLRGVRVAGKTGTAQKFDPTTDSYSKDRYIAWFIGAVPAESPRLVIVVALDEPRSGLHSGGVSAAPLFAQVAAAQLARRGIFTEPEVIDAPPAPPAAVTTAAVGGSGVLVPDFRGLSVRDVMQITSQSSLELHVDGRGLAVHQEPSPGTILRKPGGQVRVRFALSQREEGEG